MRVHDLPDTDKQQEEPLDDTVGGSCSKTQKERIVRALAQYGWQQSAGVRTVLLAFTESAAVRDAVFEYLHARAA